MKLNKYRIITLSMLFLVVSYNPTLFLAQTLDELEQEIAQIKEDTEKQKEEQAQNPKNP